MENQTENLAQETQVKTTNIESVELPKTEEKPTVQENIPTEMLWEFEGKKYEKFLVNGTGGCELAIMHPNDETKIVGYLGARFSWEDKEPFLDRADIETVDKANKDGGEWTDRENDSIQQKNRKFFYETVQNGYSVDVDDFKERSAPKPKNREDMLKLRGTFQSDLVDSLLIRNVKIERLLSDDMNSVDAFLTDVSEIVLLVKIGDAKNPRHLIKITCNAPSDDALGNYTTTTFKRQQNQNSDWKYFRDQDKRIQFFRKHVRNVEGIVLGPTNNLEPELSELYDFDVNNKEHLTMFKKLFNPQWQLEMADFIASAFSLGKK